MTDKFRELANRLAKGINRDDCFAILISSEGRDDGLSIDAYVTEKDAMLSVIAFSRNILRELSADNAEMLSIGLKRVIAEYEERRFQKGETE